MDQDECPNRKRRGMEVWGCGQESGVRGTEQQKRIGIQWSQLGSGRLEKGSELSPSGSSWHPRVGGHPRVCGRAEVGVGAPPIRLGSGSERTLPHHVQLRAKLPSQPHLHPNWPHVPLSRELAKKRDTPLYVESVRLTAVTLPGHLVLSGGGTRRCSEGPFFGRF